MTASPLVLAAIVTLTNALARTFGNARREIGDEKRKQRARDRVNGW